MLLYNLVKIDQYISNKIFLFFSKLAKNKKAIRLVTKFYGTLICIILLLLFPINITQKILATFVSTIFTYVFIEKLVKKFLKRQRPNYSELKHTYSFPSGHSFNTMLLCLFYLQFTYNINFLAYVSHLLIPIITGFSRVGMGYHYLSDIIFGWGGGLITFILINSLFTIL